MEGERRERTWRKRRDRKRKKEGGERAMEKEKEFREKEKRERRDKEREKRVGGRARKGRESKTRGEQKDKIGSEVQIWFIIYYSLILLSNGILIIINYGFNCLYHPLACGELCPRLTRFSTPGASSHISANRALG